MLPWGAVAVVAVLWPSRISGPFDGVPLDGVAEAILIGVVFPALWWFHPRFLSTRAARAALVILLVCRVAASAFFVQGGWCVRFAPTRPYVEGGRGAPHAWDLRADWRAPDPACSAIMTRPYERFADFPAWFFNLRPVVDGPLEPGDRPPGAAVAMTVQGFLSVPEDGVLRIDTGEDVSVAIRVDGGPEEPASRLAAGVHTINIVATLTGDRWRFVPTFNHRPLFTATTPTVRRPSRLDLALRRWIGWLPTMTTALLLTAWAASALIRVGEPVWLGWTAFTAIGLGILAGTGRIESARSAVAIIAAAALLPIRARLRNTFGAFVAIGIPWLTFIVVASRSEIGRFTLYSWGDDWWTFQRFAYRIVMQGYWLEGGSATFWFQPLYRWIAAVLHVVFGDSSVGEWYWDAACLLAGSLFSFQVVRRLAGFRWGLIAAAAPLALVAGSNEWVYVGRGLGEISSGGLVYLAAVFVMRSRHRGMRFAVVAGVIATLGFYTRLNNLPFAIGAAVFVLPLSVPAATAFVPSAWWRRVAWRPALAVASTIGVGLALFAWRTWYYTGVFSVLYGTARDHLAIWQPGMTIDSFLVRAAGSVMMVLTMNDPARYDPYALPVLGGAAVAVLSLLGVPRLRRLPLALVLFFFSSLAGALVARGTAYSGRFSFHVIPVTCALSVSAIASIAGRVAPRPKTTVPTVAA